MINQIIVKNSAPKQIKTHPENKNTKRSANHALIVSLASLLRIIVFPPKIITPIEKINNNISIIFIKNYYKLETK